MAASSGTAKSTSVCRLGRALPFRIRSESLESHLVPIKAGRAGMMVKEVALTLFGAITIGRPGLGQGTGSGASTPAFKELRGISCRVDAI
jgi:hypothetical protein